MTELLNCYNKGCLKKYDPAENNDDSCCFHPGVPVFHDAYKSWSCCNKRSVDFTEFLNYPGCTRGPHSNIKPVQPQKEKLHPDLDKSVITVETPKPMAKEVKQRPPSDAPMLELTPTIAASLKSALEKRLSEMELNDKKDEIDGSTKAGTPCVNKGCTTTYSDDISDNSKCVYHSGYPVFHEGCKFWSCCNKKTSDFNDFLKQPGCTTGVHKWQTKEDLAKIKEHCRFDHHQTGPHVILTIYSKVPVPESSKIEVNAVKARVKITYEAGKKLFEQEFNLHGVINPEKCSVNMMGSKVEIKLLKAEPGSWPNLELK